MTNQYENTRFYEKSIPRTMPMLPEDPRKTRLELIVTYQGHKQSRGIELQIPPEEVRKLLKRMEEYLVGEATYYTNKINIDRRLAEL